MRRRASSLNQPTLQVRFTLCHHASEGPFARRSGCLGFTGRNVLPKTRSDAVSGLGGLDIRRVKRRGSKPVGPFSIIERGFRCASED